MCPLLLAPWFLGVLVLHSTPGMPPSSTRNVAKVPAKAEPIAYVSSLKPRPSGSTTLHACIHACILGIACMHTYIHAYIHTYIHACMHTYIHACIHATQAQTHTQTQKRTEARAHTDTHTQVPGKMEPVSQAEQTDKSGTAVGHGRFINQVDAPARTPHLPPPVAGNVGAAGEAASAGGVVVGGDVARDKVPVAPALAPGVS